MKDFIKNGLFSEVSEATTLNLKDGVPNFSAVITSFTNVYSDHEIFIFHNDIDNADTS